MATLTTTPIKTFVSGETVTPTKLNELSQSAVALTAGTIVDADVSASAAIALSKLATGALPAAITVASANLVDGTIATADIANAAVTTAKLAQPFTLDTAKASTSGTSIDFTGIPSWAKRVTVMLSGVSTNGTSSPIIQIGVSGVVEDTGYNAQSVVSPNSASNVGAVFTTGFGVLGGAATNSVTGLFQIQLIAGNTFIFGGTHTLGAAGAITGASSGVKTLSGPLDRVRITTVNGIDTFDAGAINISYEG